MKMEVRLRVTSGRNADRVVQVVGPKFFIGRAEECQLRPHTDTVSRHHCVLLFESNCILVRDLGSKNGTFVNDKRVQREAELKDGDRLRVAQTEFEVHMGGEITSTIEPTSDRTLEADLRTITLAEPPASPRSEQDLDFDVGFGDGADQAAFETTETRGDQAGEADAELADAELADETQPGLSGGLDEAEATKPDVKQVALEPGTSGPGPWHQKSPQERPAQDKPLRANTRDAAGEALKQFLRGR